MIFTGARWRSCWSVNRKRERRCRRSLYELRRFGTELILVRIVTDRHHTDRHTRIGGQAFEPRQCLPVSYTHLTLPTILRV